MAIGNRDPAAGTLIHSDHGAQFTPNVGAHQPPDSPGRLTV